MTLIQQVVSDERRGQVFAVLGSLVQTFTLIGTLAAGPLTETVGPRLMWGISAGLLVLGFVNIRDPLGGASIEGDRGAYNGNRRSRASRRVASLQEVRSTESPRSSTRSSVSVHAG